MTILVDWQIRQAIETGLIEVSPYVEGNIQPNSLDVTLGYEFVHYTECLDVIDPYKPIKGEQRRKGIEWVDMPSHRFLLGSTVETITLPDNIVATIEGKSSLARLGITIHQTGGFIDAGFSGQITLEISNVNCRPVRLYSGMPIGQIVFYETEHAEVPYNKKEGAKYCGQTGPTMSKYYENAVV